VARLGEERPDVASQGEQLVLGLDSHDL
jgi:hypothetical protein